MDIRIIQALPAYSHLVCALFSAFNLNLINGQ
jgi:hypothetical protein